MNLDPEQASAFVGLPRKKPTHRGKRSRGHGPKVAPHVEHHETLNVAMETGDHPTAKNAALSLAKALHKLTSPKPMAGDDRSSLLPTP